MEINKLVVYSGLDIFMNNKVLDHKIMSSYIGGEAIWYLFDQFRKEGYTVMTLDHYLKHHSEMSGYLIADMAIGHQKAGKLKRSVCYSFESPVVALRYYGNIRRKTKNFDCVIDWSGVEPMLSNRNQIFIANKWPMTSEISIPVDEWYMRKGFVIINSYKLVSRGSISEIFNSFFRAPRTALSLAYNYLLVNLNPWLNNELYTSRISAIKHFSSSGKFELYGKGWDSEIIAKRDKTLHLALLEIYKGEVEDKIEVLANFKFCLCFENTSFKGYVTEKLFDCLYSGTIPIYLGDPEIDLIVPSDVFIDVRKFDTWEDLELFCNSLTNSDVENYLTAAKRFLASKAFKNHSYDWFTQSIMNVIKNS
jgi:hypothetical protein